jgi:alpha-ketoglutarate-dependent taurine dioxygenase
MTSGRQVRGFPGATRQAVPAESADWVRAASPEGTLPLEVRAAADVGLAEWARSHPAIIDGWLTRHGAVLFAGFGVRLGDFPDVAAALAGPPEPYRERSSPRTQLAPGVYSSTDHPADQPIALHNENSYQAAFPARLVFCCLSEADRGGGTPLADCRRVLARLPAPVVASFRARQVRYVRNYGGGLGLAWQDALGPDPGSVERYCREAGLVADWQPGGRLRTTAVRPAIAVHPGTGEETWFNHAAFFHVSSLPPELSAALLDQVGEAGLPTNTYYGDGGRIEPATLAAIREAYAREAVCTRWRRGDVLLVDNLLVAHGRQPFTGDRQVVVSMSVPLSHDTSPAPEQGRR